MKNLILSIGIILITFGCSKDNESLVENNPHNLLQLGLNSENNIYPEFPYTYQYLGSNTWYDLKHGDTLVVFRRDFVTEDSGDDLTYKFLIKQGEWIKPLTIERRRHDASVYTDSLGNILPTPGIGLVFLKPIVNFRLQEYKENKVLACEIETPNGGYFGETLIDRMWIKLDD